METKVSKSRHQITIVFSCGLACLLNWWPI